MRIRWDRIEAARLILLFLIGLCAIVVGVWIIYMPAGLITLGLAVILFAYMTDMSPRGGE